MHGTPMHAAPMCGAPMRAAPMLLRQLPMQPAAKCRGRTPRSKRCRRRQGRHCQQQRERSGRQR
eukprot:201372-Chlamydomonas_euryale.AAC.1